MDGWREARRHIKCIQKLMISTIAYIHQTDTYNSDRWVK